MQLHEYVAQVHDQLIAAAALGDERTQHIAQTVAAAATPAMRLAIMTALSEAADEITAALLDSPGAPTVAVRLDGDAVRVDIVGREPDHAAPRLGEGDASARISLRLPESLKSDVETAAGRDGISVNSWLVHAAAAALNTRRPGPGWGDAGHRRGNNAHHITGWING